MPRLKPTWLVRYAYGLDDLRPADQLPPIDVCTSCYEQWESNDPDNEASLDVEHPLYGRGIYYCFGCRRRLHNCDNKAGGEDKDDVQQAISWEDWDG